MDRQTIINQAQAWYGLNAYDLSYKPIIELYNANTTGYKLSIGADGDAWCDAFVSAVGIACGCADLIGIFCYCPSHINAFKAQGRWAGRGYIPAAGDVIFYDWDGDGVSDHTGFVVKCDDGTITAIEGNTGNAVGYREIAADNYCIMGYGLPAYTEGEMEENYTFTFKDVYLGCTGAHVNLLQRLLKVEGFYKGKVDGCCGEQTAKAIKDFQQHKIDHGVNVGAGGADAWCGVSTWRAILCV